KRGILRWPGAIRRCLRPSRTGWVAIRLPSSKICTSLARSLVDWLDYNGFTVLAKPTKEFDDGEGRRKTRRNIGVELAVDALEISDRIDHIVLFSGDGDLRALVEAVQRRGVRVTVVSTIRTRPPMVADELRRQADAFLELDDFKASIEQTMERVEL